MINQWIKKTKKLINRYKPYFIATIGQLLIKLILFTCRWEVHGIKKYVEIATKEKCILILWHNRLALIPFILFKFAPQFIYAAFVSKSRDGEMISAVVHSYKAGRTIRVPHDARHQALKELIVHLENHKEVVIVTPDGPRGPKYEVKPGIALAALETSAFVVPITWEASKYWELNSWDKLRLPMPFTKIKVYFKEPVQYVKDPALTLEEVQQKIKIQLETR